MSKRSSLLLVLAIALVAAFTASGCTSKRDEAASQPASADAPATSAGAASPAESAPAAPEGMKDVTELKIEDLVEGTGAAAKGGDSVTVHYTGWLTDGTKFDSSVDRGQPFSFGLGQGQVISGWDQGVAGMKVGGKRRLTIPPDLGYGAAGAGGGAIPPNATLVFDVELLAVN